MATQIPVVLFGVGGAGIGYEVRADLCESRAERLDEFQQWFAYFGLVAVFVLLEPLAVVVSGELFEERDESGLKMSGFRHAGVRARVGGNINPVPGLAEVIFRALGEAHVHHTPTT